MARLETNLSSSGRSSDLQAAISGTDSRACFRLLQDALLMFTAKFSPLHRIFLAVEKIPTEFDSINAQLADKVSWSYNADGRFAKFDIENFFNGVSQGKINDAWVHCFELWQEQMGGRRRFLAIL